MTPKWLLFAFLLVLSGCSTIQSPTNQTIRVNLQRVSSHLAPVHNGNIEYYRFGSGSPIILIPGYAVDVSSWDKTFLAALAQQHQVIVLNNRNVGRSYVNASHYDMRDLATDVNQLIHQLGLKKPAVLGISMGGMIAQQFAVQYPHSLSQLILINTAISGKQAIPPAPDVQEKMMQMPSNLLGRYIFAVELFFPEGSRAQMAYVLAADRFQPDDFVPVNSAAIIPPQRLIVKNWLNNNVTAKKLLRLRMPVLILNGGADEIIPPVNSDILARSFPHAQLVRWSDGGHAMIFQHPVEMAKVISHFITTHP